MRLQKIKVIFVQRVPWGGGAERVVQDIVQGLDRARFDPEILCLYNGPGIPPHLLGKKVKIARIRGPVSERLKHAVLQALRKVIRLLYKILPMLERLHLENRYRYLTAACREKRFKKYVWEKLSKIIHVFFGTTRSNAHGLSFPDPPTLHQNGHSQCPVAGRPVDDYRQALRLVQLVEDIRGPLVLVAVMEEAASVVRQALGMRPLSSRPYLVSTHAWESYYLPVMYGQPGYDVEREKRLFAEACQGAEAVLSPCDGCRDDLIVHFAAPEATAITMPNPVDIAGIQEAMRKTPEKPLPREWDGFPYFVVVARLDPQKRHDRILQACALLRRQTEDFRMLFIGDGYFKTRVKAEAERLGLRNHVHLMGRCDNPFPYMRKAAGLICASDSESFGLVLVEALACGCVPISVDCPCAPRDVLDQGRSGFLVAKSPEALSEAMSTVLREPERAREKVIHGQNYIRRFDRPVVIQQWELLLAHIAGARYSL